MRCEGVTRSARMCTREARVLYLRHTGARRWETVKGYCAQHGRGDNGAGIVRMLRPFPWEFDRIVRIDSAGFVTAVLYDRAENPSGTFTRDR